MSQEEMSIFEMMEIIKKERGASEKYFCMACKKKLLRLEKTYCTVCFSKSYEKMVFDSEGKKWTISNKK